MTEFLWPLTLIIIATIAATAFLVANGRKYASRASLRLQGEVNEAIGRRLAALEKALDKADPKDLLEEIEALAEDVASMQKDASHVPDEAWMTEKLKPVFERMNLLTRDVSDMKTLISRYETLKKLGPALTGAKES